MTADSRDSLIESGIGLLMAQRWQDVQASIATRAITEQAGLTTGSFFHHFRNRADFADAVADRFVQLWNASIERLVADVESFAIDGGGSGVRAAANADWRALDGDTVQARLQHLLWATRDQPISDRSSITGGELLGDRYRALTEALLPAYGHGLQTLGREMLPPFEPGDLPIALTAIADGLQMRQAVDHDSVRDGLYADLISITVIGTTRPIGERAEPTELAALEGQLTPRRRPRAEPGSGETWRQIADAAAPLFVDRLASEVRVAEVAAIAGVSTSTVYSQLGSVSAVAAMGWARHLPELEAISVTPLTVDEGPVLRLEQVLTRFIELGRESRGALEGLVFEILAEYKADDPSDRPRQVRTALPLPSLLTPHLRELRTRGLLRRRVDVGSLARSILQLVSMRILMSLDEPVERIIDDTLGLMLDGALARE